MRSMRCARSSPTSSSGSLDGRARRRVWSAKGSGAAGGSIIRTTKRTSARSREGREVLRPEGKQHAGPGRKRFRSRFQRRHRFPTVAGHRFPGWAQPHVQRNARLGGCPFGVCGDVRGERVRGVHEPLDPFARKMVRQTLGPAEPACAHLARQRRGFPRPPGERRGDVVSFRDQSLGQPRRLARAAEDEDALTHAVRRPSRRGPPPRSPARPVRPAAPPRRSRARVARRSWLCPDL